MDKTKDAAGKAVGHTKEKTMMEKAGSAAQTAKESAIEAGKQVQTKTQEAVNYVQKSVAPKK